MPQKHVLEPKGLRSLRAFQLAMRLADSVL